MPSFKIIFAVILLGYSAASQSSVPAYGVVWSGGASLAQNIGSEVIYMPTAITANGDVLSEVIADGQYGIAEALYGVASSGYLTDLALPPHEYSFLMDAEADYALVTVRSGTSTDMVRCSLSLAQCSVLKSGAHIIDTQYYGLPGDRLNQDGIVAAWYENQSGTPTTYKLSFFTDSGNEVVIQEDSVGGVLSGINDLPEPLAVGTISGAPVVLKLSLAGVIETRVLPDEYSGQTLQGAVVPVAVNNNNRIVLLDRAASGEQGDLYVCDYTGGADPQTGEAACAGGLRQLGVMANAGAKWSLSDAGILAGNLLPDVQNPQGDPQGVLINTDNYADFVLLQDMALTAEDEQWMVMNMTPSGKALALARALSDEQVVTAHILGLAGVDSDGDGFYDENEMSFGSNPLDAMSIPSGLPDVFVDTDGDGTEDYLDVNDDNDAESDAWEIANGYDWRDPNDFADDDGDGFTLAQELMAGSDPTNLFSTPDAMVPYYAYANADLDGDGLANYEDSDDDGDGLGDYWEYYYGAQYGLDWQVDNSGSSTVDSDGDGFLDIQEEGLSDANDPYSYPDQDPALIVDTDGDGRENYADVDDDNDGIDDGYEIAVGLNPNDPTDAAADADTDGYYQYTELLEGFTDSDPVSNPQGIRSPDYYVDSDADSIENYLDADDDNDGMPDAWESQNGLDWVNAEDGSLEISVASDPDADGYSNYIEYMYGSDVHDPDSVPLVDVVVAVNGASANAQEDAYGLVTSSTSLDFSVGTVGLVFEVPDFTDVRTARLRFTSCGQQTAEHTYSVGAENSADATLFDTSVSYDLSNRPLLASQSTLVSGAVGGLLDETFETSNIYPVMNAVVSLPGWHAGNSIALVMTGSGGNHCAWTWVQGAEGSSPQLVLGVQYPHVQLFDTDGDGVPNYQDLDDDGDQMSDAWELENGLDPFDNSDGGGALNSLTDPDKDGYTNVEEFFAGSNPFDITQFPPSELVVPIASSADDAREDQSGTVRLDDTIINLDHDRRLGLRFAIPLEDFNTVVSAQINFFPGGSNSGVADWVLGVEDASDAVAVANTNYNLSSRTLESTTLSWSVPGWDDTGGQPVPSPDVAALLQAAMSNAGWQSGNHVMFVGLADSSSNSRQFKTFDGGDPDQTTELVIQYLPTVSPRQDLDQDGMFDAWELANGLSPADPSDASGVPSVINDPDGDGFTNLEEFNAQTDPNDVFSKPRGSQLRIAVNASGDDIEITSTTLYDRDTLDMNSGRDVYIRFESSQWQTIANTNVLTGLQIEFAPRDGLPETGAVGYDVHVVDQTSPSALSSNYADVAALPILVDAVSWQPEAWSGDIADRYLTSNIRSLLAPLIASQGWQPGDSLVFVIQQTSGDKRQASSYNSLPDGSLAPRLVFSYLPDADQDGLPDGWEQRHGLNAYSAADGAAVVNSTTDPDGDGYTNQEEYKQGSDPNLFDATSTVTQTVSITINNSSDDGYQRTSNAFEWDKPKIELDSGKTPGFRFQVPTIPQGALIESAYIQFSAKANDPGAVVADMYIETADDAAELGNGNMSLNHRDWSLSGVNWSMAGWTDNQRDAGTRTPDIASLVQQVVDRSGWSAGNHLLFKLEHVSGDKHGIQDFRDAGAVGAAELVIEYTQ